MTIRKLMNILTEMDPENDVFVHLFKANGSSEEFDIDGVHDNNGNAQLNIYEAAVA